MNKYEILYIRFDLTTPQPYEDYVYSCDAPSAADALVFFRVNVVDQDGQIHPKVSFKIRRIRSLLKEG